MKFLVTGGTGFIGACVVRNLDRARHTGGGGRSVAGCRRCCLAEGRRGGDHGCVRRGVDRGGVRGAPRHHPLHSSGLSDERRGRGGPAARRQGQRARHDQHVRGDGPPPARPPRLHQQRDGLRREAVRLRRPAGHRGRFLLARRSRLHLRHDQDSRRVHRAEIRRQAWRQHRVRASGGGVRAWAQARLGAVGGGVRLEAGDRRAGPPAVLRGAPATPGSTRTIAPSSSCGWR